MKMTMKKKTDRMMRMIAALLLIAALAAVYAGCGRKAEEPAPVIETEAQTEPETTVKATEPAETESVPETAAAEEEPEEEDEDAVLNNGGHFVGFDGKVYFHMPFNDSMNAVALFGQYLDTACGTMVLCEYDPETGEKVEIVQDHAKGTLAVSEGILFLTDATVTDDMVSTRVYAYDPKADTFTGTGHRGLLGGDKDGRYVVLCDRDGDKTELTVMRGAAEAGSWTVEDMSEYLGISGSRIYYFSRESSEDQGYDITLYELDAETGETVDLGTYHDDCEEYSAWAETGQFYADGDIVVISLVRYEGTGHFYSGDFILSAVPGQKDSFREAVIENPGEIEKRNEEMPDAFAVKAGKVYLCDGIPKTADVDINSGELFYYDKKGRRKPAGTGYEYVENEEEGIAFDVEISELVGDKVYLMKNANKREPDEDIGWRYAYSRFYTEAVAVEPDTGLEKGIMLSQKPVVSVQMGFRYADGASVLMGMSSEGIKKELGAPDFDSYDPENPFWTRQMIYNATGSRPQINLEVYTETDKCWGIWTAASEIWENIPENGILAESLMGNEKISGAEVYTADGLGDFSIGEAGDQVLSYSFHGYRISHVLSGGRVMSGSWSCIMAE